MTTKLLRPGYLRPISCTEDQCAFSGVVMSTELEVSIEKKRYVFLKRLQLFFNLFEREKTTLYPGTCNKHIAGVMQELEKHNLTRITKAPAAFLIQF